MYTYSKSEEINVSYVVVEVFVYIIDINIFFKFLKEMVSVIMEILNVNVEYVVLIIQIYVLPLANISKKIYINDFM